MANWKKISAALFRHNLMPVELLHSQSIHMRWVQRDIYAEAIVSTQTMLACLALRAAPTGADHENAAHLTRGWRRLRRRVAAVA